MKKRRLLFIVALSAVIGMGVILTRSFARVDQYQGRESAPRNMLMVDRMQESKVHCQMSLSSLDIISRQIQDVKDAGSPEKMVEGLNNAERALLQMREHLSLCNSLVQKMEEQTREGNI